MYSIPRTWRRWLLRHDASRAPILVDDHGEFVRGAPLHLPPDPKAVSGETLGGRGLGIAGISNPEFEAEAQVVLRPRGSEQPLFRCFLACPAQAHGESVPLHFGGRHGAVRPDRHGDPLLSLDFGPLPELRV